MNNSAQIKELREAFGISDSTARRWIKAGVLDCIDRHEDREALRRECAANGVPMAVAYDRAYRGYPRDCWAMPLKKGTR